MRFNFYVIFKNRSLPHSFLLLWSIETLFIKFYNLWGNVNPVLFYYFSLDVSLHLGCCVVCGIRGYPPPSLLS